MAITNLEFPLFRVFDNNGVPLSNGLVYIYEAGTSTPLTVYTDSVKTSEHTQPITLNANGSAQIWFEQSAKITVTDSGGTTITGFPVDNIAPNLPPLISGTYNLVTNGTFDTDANSDSLPDNWTVVQYTGGTVEIDSTAANVTHGTYSLKFTSVGSGGGTATSTAFSVEKEQFVTVSWTLKSSVVDVYNKVEIKWYNSSDSLISTSTLYDEAAANPTSFTRYSYPVISPSTAVSATIVLTGCDSSDSTSGSTWFDNVVVTQDTKPAVEVFIEQVDDFFSIANWTTSGTVTAQKGWEFPRSGSMVLASTGSDAVSYNFCEIKAGSGLVYYKTKIYVGTASDGTDDFTIFSGVNIAAGVSIASSIGFRYNHSLSSGNWQCITDNGVSTTATDSGVAMSAGTAQDLSFVVNDAGTQVDFYIDGTLVASNTTNIYSSNTMIPVFYLDRNAGTTARNYQVDYIILRQAISGGR